MERHQTAAWSPSYVEHANVTVRDLDEVKDLLLCALPGWRVRGEGRLDWFGHRSIRWLHVGTEQSYIALQSGGGEGVHPDWRSSALGTKHIGIVVPSLNETLQRLAAAGYTPDHWGGAHPFRKSAYVMAREGLQFEFVEYLSPRPSERNDYALP